MTQMTDKYPDILGLIPHLLSEGGVESIIVDAEVCYLVLSELRDACANSWQIVAIEAETGALQNFQTLSNRARKDVQIGDVKVNAKVFAFDLMHLNGRVSFTCTVTVHAHTVLLVAPYRNLSNPPRATSSASTASRA